VILVDPRQGSIDLIPLIPPELVKKIHLDSGDAMFFGHGPEGPYTLPIGVEYKTVKETIQTITSKRFVAEQYPKMTRLYSRIYYIMEGECKEGPDGKLLVRTWYKGKPDWISHGWNLTYRQWDNWQTSLTETGKVIFKRSRDRNESANQLTNLFHCWTKNYAEHSSLFAFDKSQLPPLLVEPSLVRLVAAQLPGIGWKRSETVCKRFSSVYEMVTAGEDVWMEIPGIGKTLAKRLYQTLRYSKPSTLSPSSQPTLQSAVSL
jgi:ERCC4-type nuclease